MIPLSIRDAVFLLFLILLLRRIHWELTIGARRRALSAQHRCLAPKLRPEKALFGIDMMFSNYRAMQEHRLLDAWAHMLSENRTHTILSRFLHLRAYMTDDPENVQWLLAGDFGSWSLGTDRIRRMAAFLGNGVFTTDGAKWKHSRDLLRPCFDRSRVADITILDKHMRRLVERLPVDGLTVDLLPLFHQFALDVVTEFLFGWSTDALLGKGDEDGEVQEFIDALVYCQNPDKDSVFGVLGLILLPDKKFQRACKTIQAFAEKIIDQQLSKKTSPLPPSKDSPTTAPPILLDALFATTQNRTTIRDELLNILAAGGDTMAALLCNLFFEIPRHPSVMAHLRSEADAVLGAPTSTPPSYAQLRALPYHAAVIKESMRLHPVVPSNSREALRDTILPHGGGPDGSAPLLVPKGSTVAYHTWAMHHRTDIYGEDALQFVPERWLKRDPPLRPGCAYIPFSYGPRICIGQNFATTEALFVLARLVQGFEIESRDSGPWRECLSITCTNLNGCKLALRKRGSAEGLVALGRRKLHLEQA